MIKKILFLSALDFKERSIQIIRKTPEAFVNTGWSVRYIVARDALEQGNYAYEQEINPAGVRIERFGWPFIGLRNATRSRWLLYILTRLAGLFVVFKLARRGAKALRREPADIIYGYEVHGVLALKLLRVFGAAGNAKTVHRFQGTCITEMFEKRQYTRRLANMDQLIALRDICDLVIMTNDGTKGDEALIKAGSKAFKTKFWVNGTDEPRNLSPARELREGLTIANDVVMLLSVSRLASWKRIDRGLEIAAKLKELGVAYRYVIVGGGSERRALRNLANELGIANQVTFTGPVPQAEIFNYMNAADIFLSTYDMSNVGNPLLEAIRMGKIIVTLNNGDTGRWITHEENGFIYEVSDDLPDAASRDIARLLTDSHLADRIGNGVRDLARSRLWTWEDRMKAEVMEVEALLEK